MQVVSRGTAALRWKSARSLQIVPRGTKSGVFLFRSTIPLFHVKQWRRVFCLLRLKKSGLRRKLVCGWLNFRGLGPRPVWCDDRAAQKMLRIQVSDVNVSRGTMGNPWKAQRSKKSHCFKSMRRHSRPSLCLPEEAASGNEAPEWAHATPNCESFESREGLWPQSRG
jgi:hypothetical protein